MNPSVAAMNQLPELSTPLLEEVHQLRFGHDMMFGIFDVHGGNLAEPEALVTSAILERPRPYDRAFLSAFVAHAVTQLWQRLGRADLTRRTCWQGNGPERFGNTRMRRPLMRWLN